MQSLSGATIAAIAAPLSAGRFEMGRRLLDVTTETRWSTGILIAQICVKESAMGDYGRRIVIDSPFETVLVEVNRAIRDEGLESLARIDVRDHFQRSLRHDFRRYFLIEAWSPALALEAFQRTLDIGTTLATTFAVHELADGETVVVAKEPLTPLAAEGAWRRNAPALAAIADQESERVARVLDRLQHRSIREASRVSAA